MKWTSLGPAAGATALWPSPRSGCGMAVVGDTLWVFGGYSKVRAWGLERKLEGREQRERV